MEQLPVAAIFTKRRQTFICRITQSSHEICMYITDGLNRRFGVDYNFKKKFNPNTGDYEIWADHNHEIAPYTLLVMRGEKEYK